MKKEDKEQLEQRITFTQSFIRRPYTFMIVEINWPDREDVPPIERVSAYGRVTLVGVGFAKYREGDCLPYDEDRGMDIAYGRALKDAWEQLHPLSIAALMDLTASFVERFGEWLNHLAATMAENKAKLAESSMPELADLPEIKEAS